MEPATKRLDGFLLTFTPKEFAAVREFLEEGEYAADSDGLKQCLLDIMDEDREPRPGERVGSMVAEFVKQNPEIVRAGLRAGVGGIGGVIGMFTKRRK